MKMISGMAIGLLVGLVLGLWLAYDIAFGGKFKATVNVYGNYHCVGKLISLDRAKFD